MTDPGVQPVDSSQSLQEEVEELRKENERLRKENDDLLRRLALREEGPDQKAAATSELTAKPAEAVQVPDVAECVATDKAVSVAGSGQVAEGACPAEPPRPPKRGKAPGPPPARGKAKGQFPPRSDIKSRAAQGRPKASEPTARPIVALDGAKSQPEGAERSAADGPATASVAQQEEERDGCLRKRLALALGPMGGAVGPPQLGDVSVEDILLRNGNPNTKIVKCLEAQLLLQREAQAVEDFAKNGALLDEDDRKEFALPSRGDVPLGKRLLEELGGSVFSTRLLPRACLLEDPALQRWFEVRSSSKDGDKSKPTAPNSSSGLPGGARSVAASSGGGSRQSSMGPGLQQSINIGLSSMKRSFGTRENVMQKLQLAVLECALEPASCDKLTQMIPKASANSERYAAWKAGTGKVKQLVEADPSVPLFDDEQLALFADTFKDLHKRLEVVQNANEDAFRRNVKEIRQAIELKLGCLAMLRSRKDRLQQFFTDTLWVCLWLNNSKPTSHGGAGHNWFKWRTVLPKLEKHQGFDDSGQQVKEHSLLRFLARHCGDVLEPEDAEALRKATQQPLESVASTAFRCIEKWFELREVDIERLGSYSGNGLDKRDQLLSRLAAFVASTSADVLKLILSFTRLLKEYGVAVVWLGDTAPFFPLLRPEAENPDGGMRDGSSTRRGPRDDQDADMLMALRQFFESYAKALASIRKGGMKRPRELVGVEFSPTSGSSSSSDSSPSPSSRLPLSVKRRRLGVVGAAGGEENEDDPSSQKQALCAVPRRPNNPHPFPALLLRARAGDRREGSVASTRFEASAEDSGSLSDSHRPLHAQQQLKPSTLWNRRPTTPTKAASSQSAWRPLSRTQLTAAVTTRLQSLTAAGGAGPSSSAKAGGELKSTTPQAAAAEAFPFRVLRSEGASMLGGSQAALAAAGTAAVAAAHNAALREGLPAAPMSSYRLRLAEIRAAREAAAQAIATSTSSNDGSCRSSPPSKAPRGESATAKAAVVGSLAFSSRPAGSAENCLAGGNSSASSEGARRRSSEEDGRDDRRELFGIAGKASVIGQGTGGKENRRTAPNDGCIPDGVSHESRRRCHLDDGLLQSSVSPEQRPSHRAANRSNDVLSPRGWVPKGTASGCSDDSGCNDDDDVKNAPLLPQRDDSPKQQRNGYSIVNVVNREEVMPHGGARLAVCAMGSQGSPISLPAVRGSPISLPAVRATRTSLCASTPRRPTPSSRPPNRAAVEGGQERASPRSSVQASPSSSVASTVVEAPVPSPGTPTASPTRRASDPVGEAAASEKGEGGVFVFGNDLFSIASKENAEPPMRLGVEPPVRLGVPSSKAPGGILHPSVVTAEDRTTTTSSTPLPSSPDRRPPIVFDPSADFEAWINDL